MKTCRQKTALKDVLGERGIAPIRIYSVFGGFHLLATSDADVSQLAAGLHDRWKIARIGPGQSDLLMAGMPAVMIAVMR